MEIGGDQSPRSLGHDAVASGPAVSLLAFSDGIWTLVVAQ